MYIKIEKTGTETLAIGIDMGGTNTRIGIVNDEGQVLVWTKVPTEAKAGPETVMEQMAEGVRHSLESYRQKGGRGRVKGIGLATPGPVDTKKGVIITSPNLPGWLNVPVSELLSGKTALPVRHVRDSNAALLGESWNGAARGHDNALLLTLGTGVGGAAIIGGRLLEGRDGFAGEFGHITVDPDGAPCGCGNHGCLESSASGTAIKRLAGQEGRMVFALASQGDPQARATVEKVATALGVGLASLANAFNPSVIVIGGGMVTNWDLLRDRAVEEMRRRAFAPVTEGLEVVPALLGDTAGVLGAARLILRDTSL